jgi:hypothetical protein
MMCVCVPAEYLLQHFAIIPSQMDVRRACEVSCDFVKLLLQHNAERQLGTSRALVESVDCLRYMVDTGYLDVHSPTPAGHVPLLFYAAKLYWPEPFEYLLDIGVNAHELEPHHNHSIIYELICSRQYQCAELIRLLQRLVVELKVDINATGNGVTPVATDVALLASIELLRWMFAHGARIVESTTHPIDHQLLTNYYYYCDSVERFIEKATLLLQHGAMPLSGPLGERARHDTAEREHTQWWIANAQAIYDQARAVSNDTDSEA